MGKIDSKVILLHIKYIKSGIKGHLDNLPNDIWPKMPKDVLQHNRHEYQRDSGST
jgi:hypothetical protein